MSGQHYRRRCRPSSQPAARYPGMVAIHGSAVQEQIRSPRANPQSTSRSAVQEQIRSPRAGPQSKSQAAVHEQIRCPRADQQPTSGSADPQSKSRSAVREPIRSPRADPQSKSRSAVQEPTVQLRALRHVSSADNIAAPTTTSEGKYALTECGRACGTLSDLCGSTQIDSAAPTTTSNREYA
jgi:hypothetical protein